MTRSPLDFYDATLSALSQRVQRMGGRPRGEAGTLEADALPPTDRTEHHGALLEQAVVHLTSLISGPLAEHAADADPARNGEVAIAVTNASGVVREANAAANVRFNLRIGAQLSACGIEVHGPSLLDQHLPPTPHGTAPVVLVHMHNRGAPLSGILAPLDVLADDAVSRPTPSSKPLFALLFAPPDPAEDALSLLCHHVRLTRAEVDIARAFISGSGLRQIAAQRGRSYTTIRNQFQTLLEKTGCCSQSEFLSYILSLSALLTAFDSAGSTSWTGATAPQSPAIHQKPKRDANRLSIPRAGGRRLSVDIHGATDGTPVLNLFSLFGPGVTRDIDAMLSARDLTLISPWRPGFGATSAPPKGHDLTQTLAEDLSVLLDCLGISACPWLARASASQTFFELAHRLPDRLTHGVVVNGLVPRKYMTGTSAASKWTNALMRAATVSAPVARMILGTGERLLRQSDTVAFLQKMYGHAEVDRHALSDPDVAATIEVGVADVVAQGLDAGVAEMVAGFASWRAPIHSLARPVTLYHGALDPNVPIAAVETFVRDHRDVLRLEREPDGGGQLSYSHAARVLDLVAAGP